MIELFKMVEQPAYENTQCKMSIQ